MGDQSAHRGFACISAGVSPRGGDSAGEQEPSIWREDDSVARRFRTEATGLSAIGI